MFLSWCRVAYSLPHFQDSFKSNSHIKVLHSKCFIPQRHFSNKISTKRSQNGSNLKSVLLRIERRSDPCVLRKTIRWNDCLERYFIEFHCRSQSVACFIGQQCLTKVHEKLWFRALDKNITARYLRVAHARREVLYC